MFGDVSWLEPVLSRSLREAWELTPSSVFHNCLSSTGLASSRPGSWVHVTTAIINKIVVVQHTTLTWICFSVVVYVHVVLELDVVTGASYFSIVIVINIHAEGGIES